MRIQPRFRPKYTQQNHSFEGPRLKASENALRITCQKFRPKNEKLDPETWILCSSSYRIDLMRTISIENEWGDGEHIDRFAILQGVFTPSLSVVRRTHFSDFRTGFSINNHRAWRDYFSMDFLNEDKPDSKNSNACTYGEGSATQQPHLELQYFQPVVKTPINYD